MRFIAITSVWLGLISSSLAAPSQFTNFLPNGAGPFNFGFNRPILTRSEFNAAPVLRKEEIRGEIPDAFLKFYDPSELKGTPQIKLDQRLENKPEENLRFTAPISGASIIIPEEPSPRFTIESFKDFSDQPNTLFSKVDANILPLTKNNANLTPLRKETSTFPSFLIENTNFPPLSKSDANPQLLPKDDPNLQQFLKKNTESLNLKGTGNLLTTSTGEGNFHPLLNGNTDFLSLTKSNANLPSLPKGDANPPFMPKSDSNFPSLSKGNVFLEKFLKDNAGSLSKSGEVLLPRSDIIFVPFLNGNPDLLSLSKSDANLPAAPKLNDNAQPLPKSDVNLMPKNDANRPPKDDSNSSSFPQANTDPSMLLKSPLLFSKSDDMKMTPGGLPQVAPTQSLLGKDPEQQDVARIPEPVKDTPEVTAAREAHLQKVAETTTKLSEPVKETPEVLAAREAHLRAATNPNAAATLEIPKYTPEVEAARQAHFKAYELAAKLAAESDANPKILEILLGSPGEAKLNAKKMEELEAFILSGNFSDELKRMIGLGKPPMTVEAPMKSTDQPMEISAEPSEIKGINNLAEKPQLKDASKTPEMRVDTGIATASTILTLPDTKLSSLNEFEQTKLKAATDLSCTTTTLKVKEVTSIKPTEDQRFIIIKASEPGVLVSADSLLINQVDRWKNWGIQYMFV